jgi:hypothetical protein
MAWTTISNALVAVGALPFATTIQALRDNPIAIAAGDVGAPRVVPGGLDRAYVRQGGGSGMAANIVFIGFDGGAALLAQVDATPFGTIHTSGLAVGVVGTYAFAAINASGVTVATGNTRAGGDLVYATAGATFSGALSGTWRNMGASVTGTASPGAAQTTLWLRVA